MLTRISFLPLARVLVLDPNPTTVVISITDSSPRAVRPTLAGYRDILRMEFVDVAEEQFGLASGTWPPEPTLEEHEKFSGLIGERIPTHSDATAIRAFLDKHHAAPESIAVLVHCFAGASRSAAVAKWASAAYDVPIDDVERRGTDEANERLLRLLGLTVRS